MPDTDQTPITPPVPATPQAPQPAQTPKQPDILSEATRLGGPLGAAAIGALVGGKVGHDAVNSAQQAAPETLLPRDARAQAGLSPVITMTSPDGRKGQVPFEKAADAMAAGYKRSLVPMLSPSGRVGYIGEENAENAMNDGYQRMHWTLSPRGDMQLVHSDRLPEAMKAGYHPVDEAGREMTASSPLPPDHVEFRASDGSVHRIPSRHIGQAHEIDPGLTILRS